MLSFNLKRLYYFVAVPFFAISFCFYKVKYWKKKGLKVQFGPGQSNYIDGWTNIDANFLTAKVDVVSNLDWILPLPDSSVSCCYSHHVAEHLRSIEKHFSEVHRVLVPGGVYRIGVPNGDSAISAFVSGKNEWFSDFPKKWGSIGGKLNNFIMCEGEHLTLCTESYFVELAKNAGFSSVNVCGQGCRSYFPDLFKECIEMEENEKIPFPHTMILELAK